MADDYVCTLDAATIKKAADELNELPSDRLAAVQSLRQWVQQQPHIKCPTEASYLLAFLRARKFSQLEARALLEKHLIIRNKYPERFRKLDPRDKMIQTVLRRGICIKLPGRDKQGRGVVIMRPGKGEPSYKLYAKSDMYRAWSVIMDSIFLLDEMNQVNGVNIIVDFDGFALRHQTSMSMDERKKIMQIWQGGYPARMKGFHVFNIGAMFEFVSLMIRMVVSDTIKDRIHVHGQVVEGLYKHFPMEILPEEYLPDDYDGPKAGNMNKLIEDTVQYLASDEIVEKISRISSDQFSYNEAAKPKDNKDAPHTLFRKLNID